ncbi:hypothetical protein ABZP36_035173 [Zizania latifolia]
MYADEAMYCVVRTDLAAGEKLLIEGSYLFRSGGRERRPAVAVAVAVTWLVARSPVASLLAFLGATSPVAPPNRVRLRGTAR